MNPLVSDPLGVLGLDIERRPQFRLSMDGISDWSPWRDLVRMADGEWCAPVEELPGPCFIQARVWYGGKWSTSLVTAASGETA